MKRTPLAIAYARALMELAREADRLRPVLEDVRFLGDLFRQSREFRTFIEVPSISSGAKRESLDRILRGKLDDLVLNFLELLVDKHRQFLLPEIFEECEELYDQAVGRLHVEAVTAVPLGEKEKAELAKFLEERSKKTVILVNKVRPEVLGGLVLRYHDLVADDSVRTGLEKIAVRMKSKQFGSELVHEN